MKSAAIVGLVLIAGIAFIGCGQPPAANSQDAIETSQTKGSPQQQADYLVGQAKRFLSKNNYEEAIKTANYVLTSVDQTSAEAQNVIAEAQQELQKAGQQKLQEMQENTNRAMDNMRNAVGSWGQ